MLALDENLSDIVETLMTRFSSREGYKAFDDAISTSQRQYPSHITILFMEFGYHLTSSGPPRPTWYSNSSCKQW